MFDGASSTTDHLKDSAGRALVLHPVIAAAPVRRDPQACLDEAVGLAKAIDLDVMHAETIRLSEIRPSTFIGKGNVERFGEVVKALEIGLVFVDATLGPVQQRNLEREWQTKVIDRTGLILEIFGARARTHEGRLQVELAALDYQRSRLVRSWTHLERQRGGFGFLGGPGESQLEIDRRLIGKRITKLRRELVAVKRTRGLHRQARRRDSYPVVALVGYTNAGKSTLFNRLTKATVLAEDMLFATLDPTMRALTLPSGRSIVLSDTVGFISDLPTELIAAFQATLEEVSEADIVIHVRDVAHPDSQAQKADVEAVLESIGLGEIPLFEVLNKMDLLDPEARQTLLARSERAPDLIAISALTGEGCDALLETLDRRLAEGQNVVDLEIALSDGAALAWIYQHGRVIERHDEGMAARLVVALDVADEARFRQKFQAGSR